MKPNVVRIVTFVSVAVGLLAIAVVAMACVPQRGKINAENLDNNTEVNASAASAISNYIAGDGNPDTRHFSSWCGDVGGHPVDAIWAKDGDQISVEVDEVSVGEVSLGLNGGTDPCPESTNRLPQGEQFIYLGQEDGDSSEDGAYVWDEDNNPGGHYDDGWWNFAAGDGRGCYPPDRGVIEQPSRITINADGSGSQTFPLDARRTNDFTGSAGAPQPDDEASVLCVGEDVAKGGDAVAIFVPVVVTQV